jgi:hypothetical protein
MFTEHPASAAYSRDFARSRKPDGGSLGPGKMNRLYAIESVYTHDRRPRRPPPAGALRARPAGPAGARRRARRRRRRSAPRSSSEAKVAIPEGRAGRGSGAPTAAPRSWWWPRQPAAVHALVAKINAQLGRQPRVVLRRSRAEPPRSRDAIAAVTARPQGQPGRDPGHPRRQPGLRRPGRPRLRRGPGQGQDLDPPVRVRQRDLGEVHVARAQGPLPRVPGATPAPGTAPGPWPAADPAAVRRHLDDRVPRASCWARPTAPSS